jgi:hypothetical protein
MATVQGQQQRGTAAARRAGGGVRMRPFVLSRAFFAGSQRFGAIWTGDNEADWAHLRVSAPMLLSIGLSGLTFAGADVGGFFKNPNAELMTRWFQAGALQPFFRAHAHLETKRREPWLFGDDTLARLRDVVRGRYALLPTWYTLFYEASQTGLPVVAPVWLHFPGDASLLTVDDEWLVGGALLVRPVYAERETSVPVLFPGLADGTVWYETTTHEVFRAEPMSAAVAATASKPAARVHVPAPIERTPVFQRGGSILVRRERVRRCSALMRQDPYTLVVALPSPRAAATRPGAASFPNNDPWWAAAASASDAAADANAGSASAAGLVFLDDEETDAFRVHSAFQLRRIEFVPAEAAQLPTGPGAVAPAAGTLRSVLVRGSASFEAPSLIERIVILGVATQPSSVTVVVPGREPRPVHISFEQGRAGAVPGGSDRGEVAGVLTIRKPDIAIGADWQIVIKP